MKQEVLQHCLYFAKWSKRKVELVQFVFFILIFIFKIRVHSHRKVCHSFVKVSTVHREFLFSSQI